MFIFIICIIVVDFIEIMIKVVLKIMIVTMIIVVEMIFFLKENLRNG